VSCASLRRYVAANLPEEARRSQVRVLRPQAAGPGDEGQIGYGRLGPWTDPATGRRHITLAMLALAFLTVAALTEHAQPPPAGLIPLTRNEIARLAVTVINGPARDARGRLRWSHWRRRHQHTARACHYQRQAADDP
jgi:hypothetical protein